MRSAWNSLPPWATNWFIISSRPWRHSAAVLAARSTPTSLNPLASRLALTRLYSAGTTRRLVRSPAAPKITIAQGGATTAPSSAAAFLAFTSWSCLRAITASILSLVPLLSLEHFFGGSDDPLRLETELPLQLPERRRGAEGLHADDLTGRAD